MKTWSLSTTVRNPERLREFLRVAKELEGEVFDRDQQAKYQILLIQQRLYRPTKLTKEQRELLDDADRDIPFAVAQKIFTEQGYEDPSMRGRTSIAPLKKMGFCTTDETLKITALGDYFLSEGYDIGNVFLSHFLKWQLPNPASKDFSKKDGFDIKPFLGTLLLIDKVNKLWERNGHKPKGLSKDEFSLFVPTLIDKNDIDDRAQKINSYREEQLKLATEEQKRQFRKNYRQEFITGLIQPKDSDELKKFIDNLRDYGDNTIRYFRLTRFIHIRGGGYYVDLEPRRMIEIESLFQSELMSSLSFASSEEYNDYLSNINLPVLPWETKEKLKDIAQNIENDIGAYLSDLEGKGVSGQTLVTKDPNSLSREELLTHVAYLREFRLKLQEKEIHIESQDASQVKEYITAIDTIFDLEGARAVELEKLATLSLNALNDALRIHPNYPVGDDNLPTNTAPGGVPDIECYYENFNAICEVTMLQDRSQWYNEGQPVMRHLRDFEDKNKSQESYCLFLAPKLHVDTLETFWVSNKHGYRGSQQKIVPMTLGQFTRVLTALLNLRETDKKFSHQNLKELYEEIVKITHNSESSSDWIEESDKRINAWTRELTGSGVR